MEHGVSARSPVRWPMGGPPKRRAEQSRAERSGDGRSRCQRRAWPAWRAALAAAFRPGPSCLSDASKRPPFDCGGITRR